jgi:hypothetical protein
MKIPSPVDSPRSKNKTKLVPILLAIACLVFACCKGMAASATLTPVYVAFDGKISTNTVGGQTVWQCVSGFHSMYFSVPSSFTVSGQPVYVQVTYYDAGDGWIKMEYDGTGNAYTATETHSRSSRIKTQTFVTSYHQLAHPVLAGNENGSADLRLTLQDDDGTLLSVLGGSVIIQDTPFTDAQFQQALTKPWLAQYAGETRTNDDVDATYLTDKVMCGFQGWFGAPNDLQDEGWVHWCRSGRMITNNLNTDQWPDMSLYPSTSYFQAEDIKTKSGKTAYVFSDASPEAVDTQFKWMRQEHIDGVFLQRFLKNSQPPAGQNPEWALANVRQAANLEGRVWCIEYDLSLIGDSSAFSTVTDDWIWLVNTFKLLQDSRYGHQSGKPVVAIYGMGSTNTSISVATANKIISWFKTNTYSGPCYVWGGVPLNWLSQWSIESSVYTNFNAIEAWHSSAYAADIAKCATWGATYWPILWPGFSWSNEQKLPANNSAFKDRFGGLRYWTNVFNVMTNSTVNNLFVGMFDEYDEGTAIMPMSDDPPPSPVGTWRGAYMDNESAPSDWWLLLTGEAQSDMFKQRANSLTMPTQTELANRSNIGPQVDDTLATTDFGDRLYRVPVSYDGNTAVETQAGLSCRYNITPTTNHYFYFNVDDNFSFASASGADMTIEVEYYDAGGNVSFELQYDSTANGYTTHSKVITTQGTLRWRTVRYEIADAYFGNRENGGSDFRIYALGNAKLDIRHVWVRKEEKEYSNWAVTDVGSVGVAGSGDIDDLTDIYTVNGSGTDIYGTADSFAFCNQTLAGDGQVIARVNSVENTASAAKAGVMIRGSVAAGSPFAAVVVTPGEGIFYLRRLTTGAAVTQTTIAGLAAPYWLKITRTGNAFNAYSSPDGVSWTLLGSDTISMSTNVLMGLAVSAKNNTTLNTSVFQDVSVTGGL